MIVLDASVAVEILSKTAKGADALNFIGRDSVHAPYLLDVEVVNAFRKQSALGAATADRAREAVMDLRRLPVTRHEYIHLLERIWELRTNFSAYDACYLALAEELDATLVTMDSALATARLHYGRVEILISTRLQ